MRRPFFFCTCDQAQLGDGCRARVNTWLSSSSQVDGAGTLGGNSAAGVCCVQPRTVSTCQGYSSQLGTTTVRRAWSNCGHESRRLAGTGGLTRSKLRSIDPHREPARFTHKQRVHVWRNPPLRPPFDTHTLVRPRSSVPITTASRFPALHTGGPQVRASFTEAIRAPPQPAASNATIPAISFMWRMCRSGSAPAIA
jgi:hypothetical protein